MGIGGIFNPVLIVSVVMFAGLSLMAFNKSVDIFKAGVNRITGSQVYVAPPRGNWDKAKGIDVTNRTDTVAKSYNYGDLQYVISVNGRIKNVSKWTYSRIWVKCNYNFSENYTEGFGNGLQDINLKPGETTDFSIQVKTPTDNSRQNSNQRIEYDCRITDVVVDNTNYE